jgi:murein DD-endopeptidase MepM/ murein hydrolase activator NlpD
MLTVPARILALAALVACAAPVPTPPTVTVTHRERGLQPGEVVVLTVTAGAPLTAVRARAFDKTFDGAATSSADAAAGTTWQVLVGLDLDVAPGAATFEIEAESPAGPATATVAISITGKDFPTRRLTVDPNFVDPPADVLPRIVSEAKVLNTLWARSTPRPAEPLLFAVPVPHRANSAFGTRSIFNGQPRGAHGGADFLSPSGTPIKAPARGTVVLAEDLYYTGGSVVIDHGLGLYSLFAHLSKIDAIVGTQVSIGDVVGQVGRTGRVTGAHLHWTVRLAGTRVDPLALVELLPAR